MVLPFQHLPTVLSACANADYLLTVKVLANRQHHSKKQNVYFIIFVGTWLTHFNPTLPHPTQVYPTLPTHPSHFSVLLTVYQKLISHNFPQLYPAFLRELLRFRAENMLSLDWLSSIFARAFTQVGGDDG